MQESWQRIPVLLNPFIHHHHFGCVEFAFFEINSSKACFHISFSVFKANRQMASSRVSAKKLAKEILGVGKKLQALPSSIDELLTLLEKAESILTKVDQRPPGAIELALVPLNQMLITNEIMRHTDVNIQIAVACCFMELTRISAPDFTYSDADMKELSKLCIIVLKHLPSESGRNYSRALRMLENIARLKSSAILLDVDSDDLIVEMFELFFSAIRPNQPADTFGHMETIMSHVIQESRKISFKLLIPLLDSVKMDNKNISPISWELGNTVFKNCSDKLQRPLKKTVRAKNLDVAEYAEIIASLCQGEPIKENMMAKEVGSTDLTSKSGELSIYEPEDFNPHAKSAGSGVAKKKKEDTINQRTDLETSSRRKLLKTGGMKKGSNIQKKTGKKGAGSSTITKKIDEQTDTKINSEGKDESPFLDQHGNEQIKNEFILKKHESSDAKKRSRSHLGSEEDLIDLRIKVWWPDDSEYYPGTIVSFDHAAKKHKVIYDDGDEEILFMDEETWEPLDDHQIQDSMKHDTNPPAPAKKPVVPKKKKGKSKLGPSKKQKASSASGRAKAEKGCGINSGEVSVPVVGVEDEPNAEMFEMNSAKKNDEKTETLVTETQPSDGTTLDVEKD
ncbi:sister chromatid cohesion protein PDS5 homolog D-like isoform X1 [Primulina huaijiensis]|uniref:sister chromatid cohesion protein PDS5 homolog D-like isoform X1 n=2 Tax=Primulina huaijiensis TaxID=1492673 RepID=UPI003CC72A2B